jgi:hypothetical protein
MPDAVVRKGTTADFPCDPRGNIRLLFIPTLFSQHIGRLTLTLLLSDGFSLETASRLNVAPISRAHRPHLAAIPPEHPQDLHNTQTTAVRHEVCPSKHPSARSPRRVRARRRGQFAFEMCFHIAKLSIKSYWVNCNQLRFWFQVPDRPRFKFVNSCRALILLLG